ncbi:hypothetical protein REPUB_Repub08aG0049600 [Reevesia pubescens]
MDSDFRYFFEIWEGKVDQDDKIPDEYEGEVDDQGGRFRCCHGLIDRQDPDSIKLAALFEQKLFHQSSSYTPFGQEVPERVRDVDCRCGILNFTESLLRDARNMSRSKFLIVVKFGAAFIPMGDNDYDEDDDSEMKDINGDTLREVLNEQMIMSLYNDDYDYDFDDDYSEIEDEEEDDTDGETLIEVNEQMGFVPASKSAIEALEKVSGFGNSEICAICLGKEKEEEEAKRMPCGHLYHGDCIVQWLEKSNLCPLCRYTMPPIDSSSSIYNESH